MTKFKLSLNGVQFKYLRDEKKIAFIQLLTCDF